MELLNHLSLTQGNLLMASPAWHLQHSWSSYLHFGLGIPRYVSWERAMWKQDGQCNFWGPVQIEKCRAPSLIQKILKISRQEQESIKQNVGLFWVQGPVQLHRSQAHDAGRDRSHIVFHYPASLSTTSDAFCTEAVTKAHPSSREREITPHLVGSDHVLEEHVGLERWPFPKIQSTTSFL